MRTHPSHRHTLAHGAALPALATNRLIDGIAASMVGVFLPIFLYEFFHASITVVLIWFLVNFLVKLPFYVLGAKLFSRIGLTRSMVIGTLGVVLFHLSYFFISEGAVSWKVLMAIGIGGLVLNGIFYWSPFHIDMANFTSEKKRGSQLGIFYAVERLLGVIAPLLAGYVIATFGYQVNFFIGLIITVCSLIPLLFLPRFQVSYEFSYLQSFRELFSKRFRAMTFSMMAFGAENMVGVVIWPIFLFKMFGGDYVDVGLFTAVLVVIGLLLELIVGKQTDRFSATRLLKIGTGVNALGWIWKGLVDTVTGVFAAATFHSFGAIFLRTPMDALMYEQAADAGHYIDEYTVLREMALAIGRVSMLGFLLLFTQAFSLSAAFFVAAAVSFAINFLTDYRRIVVE
ncbi:MFS transporter [Candidatus Uhrbacteria bacterium]|nr:MFS transporter [Candidatus Uhrbacteria bacterium]